MAKKPQGYVEWIGKSPPPAAGYMIHSKLYKFDPQPNFNGRRLELVKARNLSATCRFHHEFIREVDIFAPEFNDEAFWARVEANSEAVKAFLGMLETTIEEPPTIESPNENDGSSEESAPAETTETSEPPAGEAGADSVEAVTPEVTHVVTPEVETTEHANRSKSRKSS